MTRHEFSRLRYAASCWTGDATTPPRSARRAACRSRIARAARSSSPTRVAALQRRRASARNDRVAIVLDNGPEMAAALPRHRLGAHRRAAQSRLSRRRVRVLSDRPQREAAGRRRGQGHRRRSRSRRSSASRSRGSVRRPTTGAGTLRRSTSPAPTARSRPRQPRAAATATTSRWCCTRRAPRRGRRSCRCRQRNVCASARNIRSDAAR